MTRRCVSRYFAICTILVGVSLLFGSSVAAQEDLNDRDRIAKERFEEADLDKDGSISKTEFKTYVKQKIAWFTQIDELIKRLDVDKDDKISLEEFGDRQKIVNALIDEEEGPKKPTEFADIYNKQFLKQRPFIGDKIKDVVALDGDGNEFKFADLKGKYTVLNFGCLT